MRTEKIANRMLAKYCADMCNMGFPAKDVLHALNMGVRAYKDIVNKGDGDTLSSLLDKIMERESADGEDVVVKHYKGSAKDLPGIFADIERQVTEHMQQEAADDCDCPGCVARRAAGASHQGEPRSDV